jgi:putative endonuclease
MPNPPGETWFVYILECADGTFYTGVTNDIGRRVRQHNEGNGARYTRGRGPVTLCYQEECGDRSLAQVREAAVKRLPREAKERLIESWRRPAAAPETCET